MPGGAITLKFDSLTNGVWDDYIIEKERITLYNATGKNDEQSGPAANSSGIDVLALKSISGRDDAIKLNNDLQEEFSRLS